MPRTKAGESLLEKIVNSDTPFAYPPDPETLIDAIEDEAVRLAHAGDAEFLDNLASEWESIVAALKAERTRLRAELNEKDFRMGKMRERVEQDIQRAYEAGLIDRPSYTLLVVVRGEYYRDTDATD